ncbi:hypothetical protein D515_00219 [Grimontia indica]|uniref:Uncharacterized protein n=1 Tax=Grimontia indica TaxID=1056512 RepID=R1ITJ1_9GAMM|nr:hypothetical protein D515_00219 [Grimontia indica]
MSVENSVTFLLTFSAMLYPVLNGKKKFRQRFGGNWPSIV